MTQPARPSSEDSLHATVVDLIKGARALEGRMQQRCLRLEVIAADLANARSDQKTLLARAADGARKLIGAETVQVLALSRDGRIHVEAAQPTGIEQGAMVVDRQVLEQAGDNGMLFVAGHEDYAVEGARRSAMCARFAMADEIRYLYAESKPGRQFDRGDLALLAAVAQQAGLALHDVALRQELGRALDELQEARMRETRLREILRAMGKSGL